VIESWAFMSAKRNHNSAIRKNGRKLSAGALGNGRASGRAEFDEANSLESKLLGLARSGQLAKAGHRAIKMQRAKGLAVTFKRGAKIIKVYPDGHQEILGRGPAPRSKLPAALTGLGKT
jgi:hypothetical protein